MNICSNMSTEWRVGLQSASAQQRYGCLHQEPAGSGVGIEEGPCSKGLGDGWNLKPAGQSCHPMAAQPMATQLNSFLSFHPPKKSQVARAQPPIWGPTWAFQACQGRELQVGALPHHPSPPGLSMHVGDLKASHRYVVDPTCSNKNHEELVTSINGRVPQ